MNETEKTPKKKKTRRKEQLVLGKLADDEKSITLLKHPEFDSVEELVRWCKSDKCSLMHPELMLFKYCGVVDIGTVTKRNAVFRSTAVLPPEEEEAEYIEVENLGG